MGIRVTNNAEDTSRRLKWMAVRRSFCKVYMSARIGSKEVTSLPRGTLVNVRCSSMKDWMEIHKPCYGHIQMKYLEKAKLYDPYQVLLASLTSSRVVKDQQIGKPICELLLEFSHGKVNTTAVSLRPFPSNDPRHMCIAATGGQHRGLTVLRMSIKQQKVVVRSIGTFRLTDLQRFQSVFGPACISPSGKYVATHPYYVNSQMTSINVFDTETFRQCYVGSLTNPSRAMAMAWRPSGGYLAVGCFDEGDASGPVVIWDFEENKGLPEKTELRGHSTSVRAVAWCADGATLISGSSDETICCWDFVSCTLLRKIKTNGKITSLCLRYVGRALTIVAGTWS